MKMNKIALACGAALMGMTAVAQAEVSANFGVTSDYVWRGLDQSDMGPAVSGGVDYSHDSGIYAGIWASSTGSAFNNSPEVDFSLGYGGEASDIGYDLGIVHIYYPNFTGGNWTDLYGSLSYGMFTAGLSYTISADASAAEGDLYYYGSVSSDIADGWSAGATIGAYTSGSSISVGGAYVHYQLDITKSAGDFGDVTLSLSDNNGKSSAGSTDPFVFVSWGKTF